RALPAAGVWKLIQVFHGLPGRIRHAQEAHDDRRELARLLAQPSVATLEQLGFPFRDVVVGQGLQVALAHRMKLPDESASVSQPNELSHVRFNWASFRSRIASSGLTYRAALRSLICA